MSIKVAKCPCLVKDKWPLDTGQNARFSGRMAKTIREIMLERISATGMSLAELQRRSGVSYDALNKLKRREGSSTSAENAQKIAAALGVDYSVYAKDIGDDGPPYREVSAYTPADESHDLVPVYDVQAQAGPGAIVDDYETIASQLAFPPDYLRHITTTDPKHLAIINVIGGSMLPRLNPGDIVMVDSTIDNIARGGMWVVRHEGLIKVKRLRWGESKRTIRLISDNTTEYPEEEHPADEVDVIGRVIWVGAKQP